MRQRRTKVLPEEHDGNQIASYDNIVQRLVQLREIIVVVVDDRTTANALAHSARGVVIGSVVIGSVVIGSVVMRGTARRLRRMILRMPVAGMLSA